MRHVACHPFPHCDCVHRTGEHSVVRGVDRASYPRLDMSRALPAPSCASVPCLDVVPAWNPVRNFIFQGHLRARGVRSVRGCHAPWRRTAGWLGPRRRPPSTLGLAIVGPSHVCRASQSHRPFLESEFYPVHVQMAQFDQVGQAGGGVGVARQGVAGGWRRACILGAEENHRPMTRKGPAFRRSGLS